MSAADIAILVVIALCVVLALRAYKKGGRSSCGGCSGDCTKCMHKCDK